MKFKKVTSLLLYKGRLTWLSFSLLIAVSAIQTTLAKGHQDVRRPPKGFIESLSDGDEFEYATYEENVNWMQKLLHWLSETFSGALSADGWLVLIKAIMFVSFLATLIFLISKMVKGDLVQTLKGAKKLGPENLSIDGEDVHELNLEQLILDNTAQGKFRLALRYTYLSVLRKLSEKGFIDWKKDKTNKEYGREVFTTAPAYAEGYWDITKRFEYLWYGETEVNKEVFDENHRAFHEFNVQINDLEKRV